MTSEGRFDYVLFLGLLYHLRYPLLVLDRLAEMTRRRLILQSAVVGGESESELHALDVDVDDVQEDDFPHLAFIEHAFNGDRTNWWLPNYAALSALARAAGLRVLARPHPEVLVTEPARPLGTVRRERLVFPQLERPIDEDAWSHLLERDVGPGRAPGSWQARS